MRQVDMFDYGKVPVSPNLKNNSMMKQKEDLEKSYIHDREKPETDIPLERKIDEFIDYGKKFGHLLLSDTMKITACSTDLMQFVIDKHKIKSIDELTCEYHKALAEILDKKGLIKWSDG